MKNADFSDFLQKSKKHIDVKNEILLILKKFKKNFSSKSNQKISIFLGATSSVLEALENGCKVVHIVSDPVLESYSDKLWPSLKIKKISESEMASGNPKVRVGITVIGLTHTNRCRKAENGKQR